MIAYQRGSVMVRTAVSSDIPRMKDNLRANDIREVWASHNHSPEQALIFSLSVSPYCMTIVNKGVPVAMFGLSPEDNRKAATIWLLGTAAIPDMYVQFLRITRFMIPKMLDMYPLLYNLVDARNEASIRWLTWAGATWGTPEPYGIEQLPFIPFTLTKSEVYSYV
jgi:hypothetical protein